jgi:predicted dehydrogenase
MDKAVRGHGMDAVILVNDFDQHAPVAIDALDRGLSVLSETAACRTVAEGVALVEAAERSAGIYMFAENYPYMPLAREMRRRYAAGDIGEVRYAEAEYLDEPAASPRWPMSGPTGAPAPPPPTTAPTRWPRSPPSPGPGRCR